MTTILLLITALGALLFWFIKPTTTPQGEMIHQFILIELADGTDPFIIRNKLVSRYNLPHFVAYTAICKAQDGDDNFFKSSENFGLKTP